MEIQRIGEFPWYFSAIYASPNLIKRHECMIFGFFEKLCHLKQPVLVALGGDFNDTRNDSKRSSSCFETYRRSRRFDAWINDMELFELEFVGVSHTWSRGLTPETHVSAQLDRALCNAKWFTRFFQASVKHLPTIQSDHTPLLISPNGFAPLASINRPFKFQAAWMTHENFTQFLEEKWSNLAPLLPMLQNLSVALQEWSKSSFHNIFNKKKSLMARIEHDRGLLKLGHKL